MSARFGSVRLVALAPARGGGNSSRFGSVSFTEAESATSALDAGKFALGSRSIRVQPLVLRRRAADRAPGAPPARSSRPPMPPTRGALLHPLMQSDTGEPALVSALRALGPLQSCREYSMAASAWGRVGNGAQVLALLEQMESAAVPRDAWFYAAAIGALTDSAEPEQALLLFEQMDGEGASMNEFVYCSAIRACGALGWSSAGAERGVERALVLFRSMRPNGVTPNAVAYNALITALGAAGRAAEAVALLDEMGAAGIAPDLVSLHAAIGACGRSVPARCDEAVELLCGMRGRGLTPVTRSYNAALSACAAGGRWREAEALLAEMAAERVPADLISVNCALSAAAKGGKWPHALSLLAQVEAGRYAGVRPDVASYGSAMQALAAAGELERGAELLERAVAALGPAALPSTFVLHAALLAACQGAGDDAGARALQARMQARGLSNQLEPLAAVTLSAPSAGATAGARLEYSNGGEPAALAAATLALCAAVSAKSPYRTADNARALPFDFVERASGAQLASSLRLHAEKKALASLLERGETELAVRINLKVCADCHAFFKGASLALGRQIRVREPKLLHTFERGECSCADGWRWEEAARRTTRTWDDSGG
ncbi:hypothetical protein T492DRAFT_979508 [Pavlovales sp. CCMP2436]|nr:hypothetical protein T492DRAFT_979508 [Pavlovales sp. CCMP2436]